MNWKHGTFVKMLWSLSTRVAGKENVKTIICDLSLMPGSTVCTLTEGFRNEQIWKLWFKLCDYLNVVRFSDLIWNLIYWYSRTVLTLSIIVWHFHNFEAVYVSLHIKLFIGNKKLYLILFKYLGTEIEGKSGRWKKFLFLFKLFMFVEDPPKEDDKEKAVEKEEG